MTDTDRCKMYVMTDFLIAVVIREEVSNHFPTVTVTLRLHRKPLYYTVNLIVPCCFFLLYRSLHFSATTEQPSRRNSVHAMRPNNNKQRLQRRVSVDKTRRIAGSLSSLAISLGISYSVHRVSVT